MIIYGKFLIQSLARNSNDHLFGATCQALTWHCTGISFSLHNSLKLSIIMTIFKIENRLREVMKLAQVFTGHLWLSQF